MIKFIQVNLNHCKVVQDLLRHYAAEKRVDVALVSDPHAAPSDCRSWLVSSGIRRAAIWLAGSGITAAMIHRDSEFVAARINGIQVVSCYASPNKTMQEFTDFLRRIEDCIRAVEPGIPLLIAGDFNARSAVWGDWCQDLRGNELSSLLDSLELIVMNEGSKPTFVGRGRGSIVDITAVSEHITSRFQDWRVCDEAESGSDHQFIEFKIRNERNSESATQNKPSGWRTEAGISAQDMEVGLILARWIGDPEMYSETANAIQRARAVEETITVACDFALESRAPIRPGKPPVHWWNPEIATQRGVCIAARRRKTRCSARLHRLRNRSRTQGLVADTAREEEASETASIEYKEARMNLRMTITRSKALSWKQLIQSVDGDVWGKLYKLVTRKLQGPPATSKMETESVQRITNVLFPSHAPLEAQIFPTGEEFPPFTIEEVNKVVHRAQRKATASGLDNITDLPLKCGRQGV